MKFKSKYATQPARFHVISSSVRFGKRARFVSWVHDRLIVIIFAVIDNDNNKIKKKYRLKKKVVSRC